MLGSDLGSDVGSGVGSDVGSGWRVMLESDGGE